MVVIGRCPDDVEAGSGSVALDSRDGGTRGEIESEDVNNLWTFCSQSVDINKITPAP